MNLSRLLSAFVPKIFSGAPLAASDPADRHFSSIGISSAGERISPESAKRIATYWACIRNASEDVAKVPLILYRRGPNGKERATDHPVFQLLHTSPNPAMTSMTYREITQQTAMSWGNGISEIVHNGLGDVAELWPISADRVKGISINDATREVEYTVRNPKKNQDEILQGRNVLDLRGPGNGLRGDTVATIGRQSLGIAAAMQTFSSKFFENGAVLKGILKHPGTLDVEQVGRVRESWGQRYEGAGNAYKTAILEDGMEFVPISMPLRDAQMIESEEFSVLEIARWFRMPPHKIQMMKDATFSNIEQQSIEYVVDTLMPWMVRWEQEIKRKLFPNEPDLFAEHLVDGLLRGDSAARGELIKDMFSVGAISPNRAMALENMPGIGPEGDKHFVPMNMMVLGEPRPVSSGGTQDNNSQETAPVIDVGYSEEVNAAVPFRPIIEDAARRLVTKEVLAAKRYGRKSSAEFGTLMQDFYTKHTLYIVKTMEPATGVLFELNGANHSAGPFLQSLAVELCEAGLKSLLLAHGKDMVDQVCESWMVNRVDMITTKIMDSEKNRKGE